MTAASPAARARFPAPPPTATSFELEIPFHHVDVLQIAWSGHYPKYLETARTLLMRRHRLDIEDMRALGYRFVVVEAYLRHLAPLRYADQARVLAWTTEMENRLRIAYQVENLTAGKISAQGWHVFATTTADGALCLETPPPIIERLRA